MIIQLLVSVVLTVCFSSEKTLSLLFKGAKKCPTQEITSEDNTLSATDKRDKMKQLFIGKDGTLLHAGNMVNKISVHSFT